MESTCFVVNVADGLHQVRLSHPHSAVYEQRVIASRRITGNRPGRRVGELVSVHVIPRPHEGLSVLSKWLQ